MKAVLMTFVTFLLLGQSLIAQGPSLDGLPQKLTVLADANPDARVALIRSLETLGTDAHEKLVVHNVLKAYGNGTLYLWNGEVVFTDAVTQDENYIKYI